MARSLLKSMGVPAPTKSIIGKTPYEAYYNRKPTVDHFRIFGCVGHVKDVTPHLSKLADRSKPMVFIGASDTTNQEDKEGVSDSGIGISNSGMDFPQTTQEQTGNRYQHATPVMNTRSRTSVSNSPYTPAASFEESVSTETLQPSTSYESSLVGPRGKRDIKSLYDATVPIELQYSGLCLLGEEESNSRSQGKSDVEKSNGGGNFLYLKNETWKLVPLLHKARLVAKGTLQRQGIDFDEVFACCSARDRRCLISIAAHEGWKVHHMDVKSSFLNGDLEEEVYVIQPPGFEIKGEEHKVLKTAQSIHAVYMRNQGKGNLIVGVYVDDLIITGECIQDIDKFKSQMKKLFSMSDLGLLSYYLGIEVCQNSQRITLNQSAYARKVLDKCGMKDCNPSQIPMEPRLKLSKESTSPPVDTTLYRSIVGSLRYLLHTRPDLAFSVGMVSRYMEKPTTEHMAAVKHICRCVKGTLNLGCVYEKKEGSLELIGYSDSDLAGDTDDRKSTSGLIFFLGSNPISWCSQKQKVVALSSCEAEYIAACAAACQGVWLGRLLADLLKTEVKKVVLKIDNQSAIALSKNSVHHERSKHIDTRFHYIRDCVESGMIEIQHVCTEDQHADILTKSLARMKFLEMRERIGVRIISREQQA
ncbi:hypothetical protein AAG906_002776 [Vitis piasezkii]